VFSGSTVRLQCWVLTLCRVAPVEPERLDACGAHAEGAVRARPAGESGRPAYKAQGQLPTWGAPSRRRSERRPLVADRSRGT
jgi:hypothetical protein